MQIKTTVRYHVSVRMTKIKNNGDIKCRSGFRDTDHHTLLMAMVQHLWNIIWVFLIKNESYILVCLGCYNKVEQTKWLKQQIFIFS